MNKIYTAGYTATKPHNLLLTAQRLNAVIVDVRISPNSRVPHWRKAALQQLLGDRYTHVPEYGNTAYRSTGRIELKDPPTAAAKIGRILATHNVILLCACQHVETCHRLDAANHLHTITQAPIHHLSHSELTNPQSTLF